MLFSAMKTCYDIYFFWLEIQAVSSSQKKSLMVEIVWGFTTTKLCNPAAEKQNGKQQEGYI